MKKEFSKIWVKICANERLPRPPVAPSWRGRYGEALEEMEAKRSLGGGASIELTAQQSFSNPSPFRAQLYLRCIMHTGGRQSKINYPQWRVRRLIKIEAETSETLGKRPKREEGMEVVKGNRYANEISQIDSSCNSGLTSRRSLP